MGIFDFLRFDQKPAPAVAAAHHASMPTTRVVATFTPTKTFQGHHPVDGTLLAHYMINKTYYIREGNTMLADLCRDWETEGRITITGEI